MRIRTLAQLLVLASWLTACVMPRTVFTQTRAEFKRHQVTTEPDVFLDRLPGQPYDSVGIIQVYGGFDLNEVVRAAKRQGQDIGCDVIVDRAIHPVTVGESPRRWTVSLTTPPTMDIEATSRRGSEFIGYPSSGIQNTQIIQNNTQTIQNNTNQQQQNPLIPSPLAHSSGGAGPHEFICGIYRPAAEPSATPPAASSAPTPPAASSSPAP
jgi:hypothetical protein